MQVHELNYFNSRRLWHNLNVVLEETSVKECCKASPATSWNTQHCDSATISTAVKANPESLEPHPSTFPNYLWAAFSGA